MVQRYNNKIKITTTIDKIYIQAKERSRGYKGLRAVSDLGQMRPYTS